MQNNPLSSISTAGIFKDAVRLTLKNPSQAYFFLKMYRHQRKAANRREINKKNGLTVPPVMIFSVTKKCNLNCKGCYDRILRPQLEDELSDADIERIFIEARDLGISFGVIVGGEPLVRKTILSMTSKFKDMVFLIFTNGILLDQEKIKFFKMQKNIIPVLSLEGHKADTDNRRGSGVFDNIIEAIERLNRAKVFFGVSLTITSKNFDTITSKEYIDSLMSDNCSFYLYLEYTAVDTQTEELMLNNHQREKLSCIMEQYRKDYSAFFMAVPGEEDKFGGCLSSGRGFIHINSIGDVEPCPFAPFSDSNLKESTLKEALGSELLAKIRSSEQSFCAESGGCSLWARRDWVRSLLK